MRWYPGLEDYSNFLFNLIRTSLKKNLNKIIRQGIKINIIGNKKGLPKDIIRIIKLIENKTFNNNRIAEELKKVKISRIIGQDSLLILRTATENIDFFHLLSNQIYWFKHETNL